MNEKVEISTAEVLRVYRLLEELNRFLHQPMHYDEHPAVVDWLKSGVYEELSSVYYEIVWGWLPEEEKRRIGEQQSSIVVSGKRNDARQLLAEIYGWFPEGFDTADLQEAQALLEKLA